MTTEVTRKTNDCTPGRILTPRVDVGESAEEYRILANIPGSSLDDIDISFESQKMHLLARVATPIGQGLEDKEMAFQVDEYRRSFDLEVCSFDIDRVKAVYQDGILIVTLPKSDAMKPRRIEVKRG